MRRYRNRESDLASRLRTRLVLQEVEKIADGGGGFTRSWTDVDTVWAELQPLSGKEVLAQAQLHSIITHRITIRYRDNVTAAMRLKLGARFFYIRVVLDAGEGREQLELLTEEGA